MYSGSELWKDKVPFDLETKILSNGRVIETFKNLPRNLYEAMVNSSISNPEKLAVSDDLGRRFSYEKLKEQVDWFTACLKSRFDIKRGDHVALMLYSSTEFCTAFLALNKIGAVAVMIPTKYKKNEVLALAMQSDLNCIICDESFEEWFSVYKEKGVQVISVGLCKEKFAFDVYRDKEYNIGENEGLYEDYTVMMFTSGTTSQSKGVMLTNFNFMHAAAAYKACLQITENDSTIIPVPTHMITGLSALLGLFLYVGGTIHMQRYFKAKDVLSCVKRENITFMHAAPTVYSILMEEAYHFTELPSLRCLACGGSGMPTEKIEKIHTWLPNCEFRMVFGMTETTSPGTILPENAIESKHLGSNGIPIPGLIFKVVDDKGIEVPPGTLGEIMITGANMLDSYYKMESENYENYWLKTGDIGYFSEDGYCYICDRKKDMINRGGEKIVSIDVERHLYQIEGVKDAAVVGIHHELYGETPAALVCLEKDMKSSEQIIQEYLKNRIAKFKIPSKIIFVDSIPLTPNGKVDKKLIRTMFD